MTQSHQDNQPLSHYSPVCRLIASSLDRIRAEPTHAPSSAHESTQISFRDIGSISRLSELVALLGRASDEGRDLFNQIYGAVVDPFCEGPQGGWSHDSFSVIGLHPRLASPAYHGHRTIKGVIFLDVDDTQTNFKRWSPHAALDRALFHIEMAQKGIAVVSVTGSPYTGGDPRHSIDYRIARGELFKTPFIITNGGAEARALVNDGYQEVTRYQHEVERVKREKGGNWQQLHDDFIRIAERIIGTHLDYGWSTRSDAVREFNERSISTKRIEAELREIPPVIVQRYTPVDEADRNGRINFYITLPADNENAKIIIAEIDDVFKEYLKEREITGIACFPGFQQSFGFGDHVIQFSYDIGVISKALALRSLNTDLEKAYGIPLDVTAKIFFGGDGFNDIFFLTNFDENVRRQAPGLLSPAGKFLVQPGFEQHEVVDGVKNIWPEERVVVLSEQHGELWCERLRIGYREILQPSLRAD
jgi:hypothetical protein